MKQKKMQAVFGSSQFLPVPSTSAAAQNSSGMGPSFWGTSTSHPVDITQGGRFTDFSNNAIPRTGPFIRASRTPFRVTFYTEDNELPGPHHKECVQTGGEVSPISDASSNGEDPSSAWPVFTGQVNQDLQGDYPGTATCVEERDMRRNEPIPLPYLNNYHEFAADWPPSASASDDSAQAGPSTSTSAATNASSLLCRVNSKDLEKILLCFCGLKKIKKRNRTSSTFSILKTKRPRKVKTAKDGKLRRSVRNRNGAAFSTVSAGSSGDLKSRNTGPWRFRSSNEPQKIHLSDDNEQADLNGAETASLSS